MANKYLNLENFSVRSIKALTNGIDDNYAGEAVEGYSDFFQLQRELGKNQIGTKEVCINIVHRVGTPMNLAIFPGLFPIERTVTPYVDGLVNKVRMIGGGTMEVPNLLPYQVNDDPRYFANLIPIDAVASDGICYLDSSVTSGTEAAIIAGTGKYIWTKLENKKPLELLRRFARTCPVFLQSMSIDVNHQQAFGSYSIGTVSPFGETPTVEQVSLSQYITANQFQGTILNIDLFKDHKYIQFDDQTVFFISLPASANGSPFISMNLRLKFAHISNPSKKRFELISKSLAGQMGTRTAKKPVRK